MITLPSEAVEKMVSHSRERMPNEACGLLAIADDKVHRVYPADNVEASPYTFTVDPKAHYEAVLDADGWGWEIGGSFHSHPSRDHDPSPTDIARSPGAKWLHVIIGLGAGEPSIGVYRIGDEVTPCGYTIID